MILAMPLSTYNALRIDCNAIVEHYMFNHPLQGGLYSICINVGLVYMGMHGNQSSTSIIVYKNLLLSTEIIIQIKYWYLVGISRWENLCRLELVFGSMFFMKVVILGQLCIGSRICKPKRYQKSRYCQIAIPY
jgi:hypothetical protein